MRNRLLLLSIFISIIGFSACKKNNDAPTAVTQVGLNLINASADTINLYLNGTRLNSTSTILPGYSTGYKGVPQGGQSYQVKKQFNTITNTIQTLFSITIPGDIYPYHSLFVAGDNLNDAFSTIDKLDTTSKTDTCFIRFVNSTPGVTFDWSYGNVYQSQGQTFGNATDFEFVNTANGASTAGYIPLKIFTAGSTTPLVTDSITLSQGNSYTFYTLGKPGAKGFNIGVRVN